jgi:hypothetical protein
VRRRFRAGILKGCPLVPKQPQRPARVSFRHGAACRRYKPRFVFPLYRTLSAPALFPFKGYTVPGKPLPNPFYPAPVHSGPFRYRFIGISMIGQQQRLCPLPFLGAVFAPIDDCRKLLPFRSALPCIFS